MRFIVASASEFKSRELSRLLEDARNAAVRLGSLAETSPGCDAAIVHYTIAHDRYGGFPAINKAQVLLNQANDGNPRIILATPPLKSDINMWPDKQTEDEHHIVRMLSTALDAWACSPYRPDSFANAMCLFHIEGSGLDFGGLPQIARGIKLTIKGYVDDSA